MKDPWDGGLFPASAFSPSSADATAGRILIRSMQRNTPMEITNTTVMIHPRMVERALIQTAEIGSEYAALPLHSYEAWATNPGSEFLGRWFNVREYCWFFDDKYDDEIFIVCLKRRGHSGECGKPGPRYLGPVRVE